MDAWENLCKKEFNFIKQERIKAALEAKESDFAAAYSEASREELSGYLRACADSLGHTPGPMEIIGSRVILERFGTWTAAVDAAGLDPVVPRRAALSLCATALYYAEEQAQWLVFRKAYKREVDRWRTTKDHARKRQKMAANKLKCVLAEPKRREQEKTFAAAHAADTDQQLYDYFKAEKRRRGKEMRPVNTIGYRTLRQRLGEWGEVMGKINADLAEEREGTT